MAAVSDLNVVTAAFLQTAVDALDLTPLGAPGRQYVAPGEPALDCCGQLTVWLERLARANPNGGFGVLAPVKSGTRGGLPLLTINVQATRCQIGIENLSVTALPDPADLQATADIVDQDGWALHCHFMAELREGGALAQICTGAELLEGVKIVPQGGCVGWTFRFIYPIEGGRLS